MLFAMLVATTRDAIISRMKLPNFFHEYTEVNSKIGFLRRQNPGVEFC